MKKIMSIVLCICMLLSLGTVVSFAYDEVPETELTTDDYISKFLTDVDELVTWWASTDLPEFTVNWLDNVLDYIQQAIVFLIDTYSYEYQLHLLAEQGQAA